MVVVCCVRGCKTSYKSNPELSLSRFTSKNTRYPDLVEKRKNSWARALGIDKKKRNLEKLLICSRHFIKGKPAKLADISNPDWVPTLNLPPPNVRAALKNTCDFNDESNDEDYTKQAKSLEVSFALPRTTDELIETSMDSEEDSAGYDDTTLETNEPNTSNAIITKDVQISTKELANTSTRDYTSMEITAINNQASTLKQRKVCDVFNCAKDSLKFPELGFHSFPKDDYKRQIWIDFCGREDDWYPKTSSKICSTHFQTDDYELASLMGFKRKNALKPGACPSMYVESIEQDDDEMKKDPEFGRAFQMKISEKQDENYVNCSVKDCENNSKENGTKLQFHNFPRGPAQRKIWTRFCLRESKWQPKKRSRICSEHFKDNDYENMHLGLLKATLKDNASPSRYYKSKRLESKKRRIVSEIVSVSDDEEAETIFGVVSKSEHGEIVKQNQELINKNQDLNNEVSELKATVAKLLTSNKSSNEKIENQISYIGSLENMWKIKAQRVKELEEFLKDLAELHEEQKNNGSTHSERVKQIDAMLSKPSIKCTCKIVRLSKNCGICNLVFPSKAQFDSHMRTVHPNDLLFSCHLCARSYSNQTALEKHVRRHLANRNQRKKYTCNVCKKIFDNSSKYEAHLLEHHNNNASAEDSSVNAPETNAGDTNFGVIIVETEAPNSSVAEKENVTDLNSGENDFLKKGFDVVIEYPQDHQYSRLE